MRSRDGSEGLGGAFGGRIAGSRLDATLPSALRAVAARLRGLTWLELGEEVVENLRARASSHAYVSDPSSLRGLVVKVVAHIGA